MKKYSWLKDIDSQALGEAVLNMDKAYKNFFRELKKKATATASQSSRADTTQDRVINILKESRLKTITNSICQKKKKNRLGKS